jgi:hypothetical protein
MVSFEVHLPQRFHFFYLDSLELADIPTKHDGTADMRYAQSKEAVASGLISKEEVLEGKIS